MTAPIKTCDFCNATGVMPTFMDGTTVCYDCIPTLPKTLREAWREIVSLRAKIKRMERQEPVFWYRKRSDGAYEGPIHNGSIEETRKQSGAWSPLYALPVAQPAPSFADAYQGAMEESAIWKKRALEAEDLNRKFLAEINSPSHMGEPAQPAPSVPDGFVWPECPKRRQSHVLFDDGYEEGWAACISTVKAMLASAPKPEGE